MGIEPQTFSHQEFMLPIWPKYPGSDLAKNIYYLTSSKNQDCIILPQVSLDVQKVAEMRQASCWPAIWWVRHSWRPLLRFILPNDIRYERPNTRIPCLKSDNWANCTFHEIELFSLRPEESRRNRRSRDDQGPLFGRSDEKAK